LRRADVAHRTGGLGAWKLGDTRMIGSFSIPWTRSSPTPTGSILTHRTIGSWRPEGGGFYGGQSFEPWDQRGVLYIGPSMGQQPVGLSIVRTSEERMPRAAPTLTSVCENGPIETPQHSIHPGSVKRVAAPKAILTNGCADVDSIE
jgi:hypothetical protein